MAAWEVRKYRNTSYKLVKIEERSKMMERLIARKVGFREIEEFVRKEKYKSINNVHGGYDGIGWC